MKQLDSLILDFTAELNLEGFGDKSWEDDSYQYMFDTVTTAKLDDSFSFEDCLRVLDLMSDTSVSLRQAYFNVLEFLGGIDNEN